MLLTAIADPTFPHLPNHHSRHLPASLTLLVYEINIWLITDDLRRITTPAFTTTHDKRENVWR